MKKSIIVTIGILLILIVIGVWVYLLFFGNPKDSDEVFTNLGITGPAETAVVTDTAPVPEEGGENTRVDTGGGGLQQLTTRPVAGFTFVGTSSERVRYVERGTAHVYEIELASGAETRISGVTIPRVVDAVFSPAGTSVALVTENDYEASIFAGPIGAESSSYITLPDNAFDPAFLTEDQLQFGVKHDDGTDGYTLSIRDAEPVRTFSIPLREITIHWADRTFVSTKPAAQLRGAIYEAQSGALNAATDAEYGFVGGVSEEFHLMTYAEDGALQSYALRRSDNDIFEMATLYIPEKCTPSLFSETHLWCGAPFEKQSTDFVESWYKGAVSSQDLLWAVDVENGQSRLISDLFTTSGRLIDIDGMSAGVPGVLFKNKMDDTLWFYDATAE